MFMVCAHAHAHAHALLGHHVAAVLEPYIAAVQHIETGCSDALWLCKEDCAHQVQQEAEAT